MTNPETADPFDIIADSVIDTDMITVHAEIGDDQAARILTFNKVPKRGETSTNRQPSDAKIAEYSQAMLGDEWYLSPQPIILSMPVKEGQRPKLLDGQQRLMALRLAAKTNPAIRVPFTFCLNAPDETMFVLDMGKARLPGDWLRMAGEANSVQLARAVKMLYAIEELQPYQSITLWRSVKLLPNKQNEFIAKNVAIKQGLFEARNIKGLVMPHVGAVLWFLMNREYDPFRTSTFFDGLASGADLPGGDARLVLREFLALQRAEGVKWDGFVQLALLIQAANSWLRGSDAFSPRTALRALTRKTGPQVFPELVPASKLPTAILTPGNS